MKWIKIICYSNLLYSVPLQNIKDVAPVFILKITNIKINPNKF